MIAFAVDLARYGYARPTGALMELRDWVALAAKVVDPWFTGFDLIDEGRRPAQVAARMVFVAAARRETGASWPEIAATLEKRGHSGVLETFRRYEAGASRYKAVIGQIEAELLRLRVPNASRLHPQLSGNIEMQRRLLESVALAPAKGEEVER